MKWLRKIKESLFWSKDKRAVQHGITETVVTNYTTKEITVYSSLAAYHKGEPFPHGSCHYCNEEDRSADASDNATIANATNPLTRQMGRKLLRDKAKVREAHKAVTAELVKLSIEAHKD